MTNLKIDKETCVYNSRNCELIAAIMVQVVTDWEEKQKQEKNEDIYGIREAVRNELKDLIRTPGLIDVFLSGASDELLKEFLFNIFYKKMTDSEEIFHHYIDTLEETVAVELRNPHEWN